MKKKDCNCKGRFLQILYAVHQLRKTFDDDIPQRVLTAYEKVETMLRGEIVKDGALDKPDTLQGQS